MRRKMLFTIFKYLFVPEIFKFFLICKLAKWWRHTLNQILIKYDEKRDLSQFVSEMFDFFCSKILLNVLHNLSLTGLLPWQHTGYQTFPILKTFWPSFAYLIITIQHAYRCVSLSLLPCLTFFELKIICILKSSGWGLEKSEVPWEQSVL